MLNVNDLKDKYKEVLLDIDLSMSNDKIREYIRSRNVETCMEGMFKRNTESRDIVYSSCCELSCDTCRRRVIKYIQENSIYKTNNLANWR